MFDNYLLNLILIAWTAAQLLKTIINFAENKIFDPERLVGAGGMPSSHSALVCSLAVGAARKLGGSSPEFAITFALAGIVMYDAMGVRRAAGEQAKVLNKLISSFKNQKGAFWKELGNQIELEEQGISEEGSSDGEDKRLKEYIGHTPMEVLGGALLGILVAMIVPVT